MEDTDSHRARFWQHQREVEEEEEVRQIFGVSDSGGDDDDNEEDEEEEFLDDDDEDAADLLSNRLLAVQGNVEAEERILRKSLRLGAGAFSSKDNLQDMLQLGTLEEEEASYRKSMREKEGSEVRRMVRIMFLWAILGVVAVVIVLYFVNKAVGPPNQPVGPYTLVERQEGDNFFNYYSFYEGPDSVGSNGYLQYVGEAHAKERGFLNVTYEPDEFDVYKGKGRRRSQQEETKTTTTATKKEPFIYMGSAPTPTGPRDSIRLEGNRRFNRGLFIIDVRHMPAGCGVWPAFWLTDEANWPVHGEIDIVEGVNYQDVAKTAMHTTKGCSMADIPLGVMSGGWDTAQGIPDKKTGLPDMTLRYARNCFVYDPHQWLNQGCVAVDTDGDSLGPPLNKKGGGVFALEWDPINRHIRTWVFSPHTLVPDNLVDAIRTASVAPEEQIMPDTDLWPTPYGYFAIGDGTDCPASHFRQMRLVFNTAFCGSVSGNRFHMDCPKQAANFSTCNEWIKSNPTEMEEAYWKIRGVFVYEREWERTWLK